MRKVLINNIKLIMAFILGALLTSGIFVYATIYASDIDYKNNQKVSDALDDLYQKLTNNQNTGDFISTSVKFPTTREYM